MGGFLGGQVGILCREISTLHPDHRSCLML